VTKKRLFGLDRSGPPPAATLAGAPLNPWTIPNIIGFTRAALIPLFLIFEYSSPDGTDALGGLCFFLAGGGDYADGIAARLTGQYSRLGALLDPLIDRALVLAGVAVCWSYDLLPHWAIAALLVREVLMLAVAPLWVRRGIELRINWPGRIAVGPTMFGIWMALLGLRGVAEGFFFPGLALSWVAFALYFRDGMRGIRLQRDG
jgi:cardiolipin synthase